MCFSLNGLSCLVLFPGSSRDIRVGGGGGKWHLWTSIQGRWCEARCVAFFPPLCSLRVDGVYVYFLPVITPGDKVIQPPPSPHPFQMLLSGHLVDD